MTTYEIVRFYRDEAHGDEVLVRGLTLAQAKAHCADPETSSRTATSERAIERTRQCGPWFDGYRQEGKA